MVDNVNNYRKILMATILLSVISGFILIKSVDAYVQIRPFEPQIINEGDIPNRGPLSNPVPREYRCYLEAGHKYHIFLVGDWVSNKTDATDYDVEVRNPNNLIVSINTESAGLPEQVANDEKHQYFIPAQSGDYRFFIYNDPKDSKGQDAAVFMIIEHLEMNTRYSTHIKGKPNVGAQYPSGYDAAYEFNTTIPEFLLFIEVPDPVPNEGITGVDMYEARVYPMANPAIDVGYSIEDIGVPYGELLTGEEPSGDYGGFNTEIEGFRFSDMRISCEAAGVDMRKIMTLPGVNASDVSSGDNVFYYLALLAEYFEGDIEFYLKTDYRPINITLIDPPQIGYTGETTLIKVEAEASTTLDSMWLEYSTDSWKTKKQIALIEKTGYWLAVLPSFNLHDNVQYRIFAEDEIDNRGTYSGGFNVMNKVEISYGLSSPIILGGQTVLITGAATRPSINLELNIELNGVTQIINLQTDGQGSFTYEYKPNKIGEHDVTVSYAGEEDYHSVVSDEKSFRVDKRKIDLVCDIEGSSYKIERPLTITGQVIPGISGLDIELVFVTPESSSIENVKTGRDGSFSLSITPEIAGIWDMLPQIKASELFDTSQGDLISFEVEQLTMVDIVTFKVMEFTGPPLMYIPIGLFIVIVVMLILRTDYMKERLGRKKEEKEVAEEKSSEEVTGYRRRSTR